MDRLSAHYARLLGLQESKQVDSVDLQLGERRVEIPVKHVGSGDSCRRVRPFLEPG